MSFIHFWPYFTLMRAMSLLDCHQIHRRMLCWVKCGITLNFSPWWWCLKPKVSFLQRLWWTTSSKWSWLWLRYFSGWDWSGTCALAACNKLHSEWTGSISSQCSVNEDNLSPKKWENVTFDLQILQIRKRYSYTYWNSWSRKCSHTNHIILCYVSSELLYQTWSN